MVSRPLYMALFVAMVGSSFAWVGPVRAQPPSEGGQLIEVQVTRVESTVSIGGTVVPYREATLSAQLPGRVEYLAGEEGDAFEAGDLLVALDVDDLLAQRRSAIAELRNAEATLRNAGVQYSRELYAPYSLNQSPGGMGMPTMLDQFVTRPMSGMAGTSAPAFEREAELYRYGTQIEQARYSLQRAESRIEQIDAKLRDARTYAPFDGVIVSKMVEIGDTVQPGQPFFKFSDIQFLQVRVDVPNRLIQGIELAKQRGDLLSAKLDEGGYPIPVRVAQIFPVADPERHTVTVKFDLPVNAPARAGMYANVLIPDLAAGGREVFVIPRSAIVYRGSLPGVYVRNPDTGEAELRLIRIDEYLDDDRVSVLSGLSPGEVVVDRPTRAEGTRPVTRYGGREPDPRTLAPVPHYRPEKTERRLYSREGYPRPYGQRPPLGSYYPSR
jgi:multidrug efflux pump subunit AcrA (membrane-fusion protein)